MSGAQSDVFAFGSRGAESTMQAPLAAPHKHVSDADAATTVIVDWRVMLVGDVSVGKTSIIRRYTQNEFGFSVDPTVGIDFSCKTVRRGNTAVRLQIWDTGGQERFRALTQQYFHRGDAFLLVYDVCNETSVYRLERWMSDIRSASDDDNNPSVFLIGNKIDDSQSRQIGRYWGDRFAKRHRLAGHYELSAWSGQGVHGAFHALVDDAVTRSENRRAQGLGSGGKAAGAEMPVVVELEKKSGKAGKRLRAWCALT